MTTATPVTILSVDDHPLIRAGLAALIGTETDLIVVAEAADGEEAVERFREVRPDIVLMDLVMPVMDGLDAAKAILAEFPDAKIIMLTTYDGDQDIYRALAAGAKGFLLKNMLRKEILNVIRAVTFGGRSIPAPIAARLAEYTPRITITPRETEVLKLLAKGFSNPEIGGILGRTEGTIKVHVKNILQKLEASDRTEAVVIAMQRGFIRNE
ncbi:MAG: response regulator transcription factor [Phycisphaerae bacterium]|nr:response regulator transcription factor [Gemmatimonadaceae bacterium]